MSVTVEDTMADIPGGYIRPHAKYPPIMASMETLGAIEDYSQRIYSRDGGRSSILGDHAYYLFGQTSWQRPEGNLVNQNNTIAIVINTTRPLISGYLSLQHDGTPRSFVAPTADERELTLKGGPEVRLQPTGGIVETTPGTGWTYYQKEEEYGGASQPRGTGVMMVGVKAVTGEVEAYRASGDLLFGPEEPRVGSLSSIIEGDYLYSWGHYGNQVLLARVPKRKPFDRATHTFWNGDAYVEDWRTAKAVMVDVQEGAVMKSGLFGAGREWVFVGGTRWADGRVLVGSAASIEGPWEMTEVCTMASVDCIYPHQWAYEELNGELMVSWREGRPGQVMAAKLKLEMGDPVYWKDVTINNCSSAIRQYLSPDAEEVADIRARCGVNVTTEGRFVTQGFSPPEGVTPLYLRVEGTDETRVTEAAHLLYWQIAIMTADERRVSGPPQEPRSPRGSLGRALRRVFSRAE